MLNKNIPFEIVVEEDLDVDNNEIEVFQQDENDVYYLEFNEINDVWDEMNEDEGFEARGPFNKHYKIEYFRQLYYSISTQLTNILNKNLQYI